MSVILATATETLFSNYSIADILMIMFLVALSVKEIWSLIKWYKKEGGFGHKKKEPEIKLENIKEKQNDLDAELITIREKQDEVESQLTAINRSIEMLIDADKNDIKAWITDRYHYLTEEKKWIDDYELDCLERRYRDYELMGGNSFIEDLMMDIRKLPKHPIKKLNKGDFVEGE